MNVEFVCRCYLEWCASSNMKCFNELVLLFGIFTSSINCRHVQFYRKDYTYVEEFDAFYKLHWGMNELSGVSWDAAFLTCDNEGATLFYPKVEGEWAVVQDLINNFPNAPEITEIFIGIHDVYGLGQFITVDGHPNGFPLTNERVYPVGTNDCLTMNIYTHFFNINDCFRAPDDTLPFVCKKIDDKSCPTVDRGYKFAPQSKKCYKVNNKTKTWNDAMRTCFMEGGILAVIENSAEANLIKDMVADGNSYFVGVRKISYSSESYSVKGQKFSELYQNVNGYSNNNVNKFSNANPNECGSVYRSDGQLYTTATGCGTSLPFICEIEVITKS